MFQGSVKDISRKCFKLKGISRMFQGSIKSDSWEFNVFFRKVSMVFQEKFQGCFKEVSRVFQGILNNVSMKIQGKFP